MGPHDAQPEGNLSGAHRPGQPGASYAPEVQQAASYMAGLLGRVASRLRPFPPFLNMVSLQAIELEPLLGASEDLGCVVVLPDGEICQLDLKLLPGVEGAQDPAFDQSWPVEEFTELDLPPEDYITYAALAVRLICRELRRRGQ